MTTRILSFIVEGCGLDWVEEERKGRRDGEKRRRKEGGVKWRKGGARR